MKRGKDNFKFSNRVLYSSITLGILILLSVGVYAVYPASGAGHNSNEINWGNIVSSGYIHASTSEGNPNLETSFYELAGTNIGGQTIYAYGSMCVGNTAGNCAGTGGTVITSDRISTSYLDVGSTISAPGRLHITGGEVLYLLNKNGVTIGREWDGNGNLLVEGTITSWNAIYAPSFIYSSDRSLKTNILPLTNSLEKVKQLEGVSFNWKSTGDESIGLIAQDVEKVIPKIVHTSEDGLKSVEYGNLVAVLIEAIKEQDKKIDSLQKQIDELKSN